MPKTQHEIRYNGDRGIYRVFSVYQYEEDKFNIKESRGTSAGNIDRFLNQNGDAAALTLVTSAGWEKWMYDASKEMAKIHRENWRARCEQAKLTQRHNYSPK